MPRLFGSTFGRLLLPLLPIAFVAAPLGAQEFLYSPPKDYLEEVAKSLTLVTAVLAIIVVGWVLLTRRRRLEALQSRVALFLGVCVLPVPVMFMRVTVTWKIPT